MDPANKSDQNQPPTGVSPVDTSYGDGATNPIPTIPSPQPVVEEVTTTTSSTSVTSSLPTSAPMDATAGNQPTIAAVPPPPSNGQTVTSFKPTRGKFTSTGIIATIFGILVLVAATVVGITQVGQTQVFNQKAGGASCDWCAGGDQCQQLTGSRGNESNAAKAVCGGNGCCMGWHPATSGGGAPAQPPSCTGISCAGGEECVNGDIVPQDSCAPQATCAIRAAEACAGKGGLKTVSTATTPPSTGGGGGSTACSTTSQILTGYVGNTPQYVDAYCPHSSYAFATCPDPICATGTQTCAQIAQGLGCYRTGGGACTPGDPDDCANFGGGICNSSGTCPNYTSSCSSWTLFTCSVSTRAQVDGLDENCTSNPQTSSAKPAAPSHFCGKWQMDCNDEGGGFEGGIDKSGCSDAAVATTPPTTPPGGTNPPGGGTSAACLNIKAYDTNWTQLTAQQLANLQSGSIVRFAVKGSATSGNFNRARFTINGVLRPEVTTTNPADPQQFYDEYTIPGGITSFTIIAEIHHNQLNAWKQ